MANYRVIALTVSSAVFMQYLDATALNTALPAMGRDLHIPVTDLNVAIIAYQLSMAALIPAGSALGDRLGARRAFILALSLFLFGSILCACSHTLTQLTAARAVQGLGGAIMMPMSRLIVVRSADKTELVNAINWIIVPGVVGPLLGPGVGGLIVTYTSWHWIFLVNIPFGLVSIFMALRIIPHIEPVPGSRFDRWGLMLTAIAIFTTVFGLESLARPDGLARAAILLAIGVGLGLVYLRHARTQTSPAVDVSLFRIPSFCHAAIAGTLLRISLGTAGFLWPLWLQLGLKFSAATAGALMMIYPVGTISSRFLSPWAMRTFHPRTLAVYGMVLPILLYLTCLLVLRPGIPLPIVYLLLFIHGASASAPLIVIGAVAYVDVPPERMNAATGLYVLTQQLTLSLGVTAGVWAIAASRAIGHSSLYENGTYAGAFMMPILVAGLTMLAASRLDERSTGSLRPNPDDEIIE